MDAKDALKEIKSGKLRPIYVLYGKDRYQLQQFIKQLTDSLFTSDERELGIVKMDTAESPIEETVLEAETLPFFVQRKLIIVRDAAVFTASGKENAKVVHQPEKLLTYLDNPMDSSVIVIDVQAEKLDERRKIVKRLKDRKSLIVFSELNAAQLKQWMIKRAAGQAVHLTQDAAELLIVRAGVNMQQLAQEVDKLCTYAGDGGAIDAEQAAMLTAATVEEDVFALIDAISELQIDNDRIIQGTINQARGAD